MGSGDATRPARAVIFDYGGVLTTSGRAALHGWIEQEGIRPETFSAAIKEWLSRDAPHGTPIHRLETGELGAEDFNRTLAQRLRSVDGSPVAPEGLLQRMFARMRSEPAMLDLVRDLRAGGVRTALLSNSWGNDYPWDLLDGLFDVAVISAEVRLRKPDPRIYRMALDQLELSAEQVVFVDDGAPNVDAARRLGMRTVLHTDPAETRAQVSALTDVTSRGKESR
ncbi:putative hydrolase of the HAD superfamily [Saccharopolyspora antimicrobica]|uniref:Hydrolase of the HAD superfamily n=1 Tax=Saccharopolyspora antimicrobica TaxID=455193 RepID=A0A1I5FFA4_9PSEU|nr:HAD family phosphatase [Saccharopolyspora antimicrobica]RKT82115.1 putative hydrolase of the HAD superfamily [Saccharopolyspora antimicrobica]SFO22414.1 putative hydrolase of the HAD superfamily [Saccharopolyspora antimicrobica]